jgi:TldD protein
VPARKTVLLSAGHLGGPLRDRLRADPLHPSTGNGRRSSPFEHAAPRGSNLVVGPGGASEEEMLHRLGAGIRVEEFDGGSVDLASGRFRLRFPAAQSVQRGRLGQLLGPGHLEGDIVESLAAVDSLLGSRAKACRQLAWCAREGKVLPVGGEAPAVIVRRLQVSPR